MLSRQVKSFARKNLLRALCTGERNIELKIDNEGIAVMNLQRRPVNSLNRGVIEEMKNAMEDVGKDETCKGLVITSAIPKIFSAGIDLSEVHKPEPENGHTAAGGFILALMSDYRVMVNDGNAKIGFNDTAIGIKPLWWMCEIINRVMGPRQGEIAIVSSTMYNPEEASKVNIIDELAKDKEDAIERCKKYIRRFDNIPRSIQSATKRQLREDIIKYIEENREKDQDMLIANIMDPYAQLKIDSYVQELKRRKVK